MKKFKLLALVAALGIGTLASCGDTPMVESNLGHRYEVIEVEGCEYLLGIKKMAHKGNCANPIHCHNQ
jgi:hypothetical protein